MIDYEKLKLIHELAKDLKQEEWNVGIRYTKDSFYLTLHFLDDDLLYAEEEYYLEDDLIRRLAYLTNYKNQYKPAWYIGENNKITKTLCVNQEGYVFCDLTDCDAAGRIMYATRKDLIQAQVDHWMSLKYDIQSNQSETDIHRDEPELDAEERDRKERILEEQAEGEE